MRFLLAVATLVCVQMCSFLACAAEPIQGVVLTLPVKEDPTNCFPQRFIKTEISNHRVDLQALKVHLDRRLWLADGLVVFGSGGKFGFCDSDGMVCIKAAYDRASTFSEKRAVVVVDDKYGYIDTKGNSIVAPSFEWAYDFWKGMGAVRSGDLWGVVGSDGRWIKKPTYKRLDLLVGGLRAETVDGKTGWIDSSGNISRFD